MNGRLRRKPILSKQCPFASQFLELENDPYVTINHVTSCNNESLRFQENNISTESKNYK